MSKLHELKQYIIEEFVPDDKNIEITDDLDLIDSGVLDSLAILKLVAFIEEHYDIALDPDEIDPENLKSLKAIDDMVAGKTIAA